MFERPTVLKRFPDGALGEPFFQKRVPEKRPDWHPDELRVDLDPQPGLPFDMVRDVAQVVHEELGLHRGSPRRACARTSRRAGGPDARDGLGDEPWPPNFPKAKGERSGWRPAARRSRNPRAESPCGQPVGRLL